jgi:hypothetical protein
MAADTRDAAVEIGLTEETAIDRIGQIAGLTQPADRRAEKSNLDVMRVWYCCRRIRFSLAGG